MLEASLCVCVLPSVWRRLVGLYGLIRKSLLRHTAANMHHPVDVQLDFDSKCNQGKLQLSLLSAEVFSGEFQMPRQSIHEGQVSCDVSADEQDYTHMLCTH